MASQAIKYQSTKVAAEKSVGEVASLIRGYGGSRFEQLWGEDGSVLGVRFAIRHPDVGELPVSLMLKTGEIERILWDAGYVKSYGTDRPALIREQAERIAWRHEKDLIEQLLLSVRLGTRTLQGAFMAEIETWDAAAQETVTLEELFARRAELTPGGRGVELATHEAEIVELPPA